MALRRPPAARRLAGALLAALLLVTMHGAGVATGGANPAATTARPIRAAFYYPWFPERWHSTDHYSPILGRYDSEDSTVLDAHVRAMKDAGLDAAISSWWGRGDRTDRRLPQLLEAASAAKFHVTAYYQREARQDPTPEQLGDDLARLRRLADGHPSWLRVAGRPVLFVYSAAAAGCADVEKWLRAAPGWYLNMKVFRGYAGCRHQPSSWHQYAPATAATEHTPYSFNVSPGYFGYRDPKPRLARDLDRFRVDVSRMASSGAAWQLVTSFNEWGNGSAVEAAREWSSRSGRGQYLDALREVLVEGRRYRPPDPMAALGPTKAPPSAPPATGAVTVAAAGDIACAPGNPSTRACAEAGVAAAIDAMNPHAVLALGDTQYEKGERAGFEQSYDLTWGRFYDRTYPAPGNHEWLTRNAQGYRDYFRRRLDAIGVGDVMYYSFDLGAWHFISLDTDCGKVGGCGRGDAMLRWLEADLAAHDGKPTLVYQHHPRWSSGDHGSDADLRTLDAVLVADRDVQLSLAGHDHFYERFGPMGPDGPQAGGLRHFVVGTGGANHKCGSGARAPGSEVADCTTFGALKLTLKPKGYDWRFVPAAGTGAFTDSGSAGLR